MGSFGMFEDLFLPGARHRDEERNRLALTREQDGESEPHRGPINLDRGTVVIRVDDNADEPAEPDGDGASDEDAQPTEAAEPVAPVAPATSDGSATDASAAHTSADEPPAL